MLARRSVAFVAVLCLLATASSAVAQGRYQTRPYSRYDWNPPPPPGSQGGSSWRGGGNWGGHGNRWHGGSYSWGGGGAFPWQIYVGPVVVDPYAYGGYDPFWPPSYTSFGYSPVNPFVIPGGTLNNIPNLPLIPEDPAEELDRFLQRGNRPRLTPEERLAVIKPSTPQAQQKSLQLQADGDQQFHELRYPAAARDYREAIRVAGDLPDNYFRLGFVLAAMRRYEDAVDQFRYGLLLDPTWPQRGEPLESIFGVGNQFERRATIHRVADWVRGDLRDADRIFLLAVCLYFDGDRDNARALFESAQKIIGPESYVAAFLADSGAVAQPPDAQPEAQADSQPVPEPPAAGIAPRPRAVPVPAPPAAGAEPVPQRPATDSTEPEKFPELKAPALPGDKPGAEEPAREVTVSP